MADAYANQLAFYDAQDKEVMRLFNENPIDWTRLTPFLDEALADPALPRMYRAKFEATAAFAGSVESAREHADRAQEAIDDMVLVLKAENRDEQYISELLAPVRELLRLAEQDIVPASDDVEDISAAGGPAEDMKDSEVEPGSDSGKEPGKEAMTSTMKTSGGAGMKR